MIRPPTALADRIRLSGLAPDDFLFKSRVHALYLDAKVTNRALKLRVAHDLIVIRDAGAAAKFEAHFQRMWDAAQQ